VTSCEYSTGALSPSWSASLRGKMSSIQDKVDRLSMFYWSLVALLSALPKANARSVQG